MKKDVSLQLIRIISMFSIILCHFFNEFCNSPVSNLSQLFNVGVFVFLFLSGYLYEKKEINNSRIWLLSRLKKIMIPIYVFSAFVFAIYIYQGIFKIRYAFIGMLNLQYFFESGIGLGHLWFITVIVICYFITPILFKYKNHIKNLLLDLIILIGISCVTCYFNVKLGQLLLYICVYILGYFHSNLKIKRPTGNYKKNIVLISLFCLSCGIRLLFKYYFDDTILYNNIVSSITHTIIALTIFDFIHINAVNVKPNKLINHIDNISYYMYITHYIYFVGPLKVMLMNNVLLNLIIAIIVSYISALLLYIVSNKIFENIPKKCNL